MAQRRWDLAVLGGGTAGLVGAQTAARLGARVVLVDRAAPGGDCLWTGCVPSKTLLACASRAAAVRSAGQYGVRAQLVDVDFAAVMARVRATVAVIAPVDSAEALQAAGVTVLRGAGRFATAGELDVDGVPVRFDRALLAAGAHPTVPDVEGLAAAAPLTSDTVWALDARPPRLVVLGGGPQGCELAQAFARLGAEVALVHAGSRLLPREDPAASALLAASLRADRVELHLGAAVTAVSGRSADAVRVVLADGGTIEGSDLLVAAGRTPRTSGLGLTAAGIAVDAGGAAGAGTAGTATAGAVVVDAALRTTNPRVWAAGDVTGPPYYTHAAGMDGATAAANAVLGLTRPAGSVVPSVTFTDPEVGSVGLPTWGELPRGHVLRTIEHHHVDRAVTDGATGGLSTLRLDARGRVVGATVVSPRAGEVLGELTVAVARGLRSRDLALVQHAYPTHADGAWNAAIADLRARLGSPPIAAGTRALLALRRARDRR